MSSEYDWRKVAVAALLLIALLWLWPNLVHEPLHLLALHVQGSEGYITYDWSVPAHPTTSRTSSVAGVGGGLLFLLLPSLFTVGLLWLLWITREEHPSLWMHGVLGAYLAFDLIINIIGFKRPYSDFRVLQAVPMGHVVALLLALGVGVWFAATFWGSKTFMELQKTEG